MAFGKGKGGNALFVKLLGTRKGDDYPYFEIVKGDEVVETDCTFIEGTIQKIELGDYEYEGKTIDTFKMYLVDEWETLIRSCSWNSISRSVINSLANLENKQVKVNISVYVNKAGYKSVYVTHNWQPIGWKFDYEKDIKPKIVPMKNAKGEVEKNDYTNVDAMYMEEVKSWEFDELEDIEEDLPFTDEPKETPPVVEDKDLPF